MDILWGHDHTALEISEASILEKRLVSLEEEIEMREEFIRTPLEQQ